MITWYARAYKPCELPHPPHTEQNLVSPEHAEAQPGTPAAAVAMLREQPTAVDYLVLYDLTLLFDCTARRPGRTPRPHYLIPSSPPPSPPPTDPRGFRPPSPPPPPPP